MLTGIIILCIGALFLIKALVPSFTIDFNVLWPLIMITVTVYHIFKEKRFSTFSAIWLFIGMWFLLVNTYVISDAYHEIFWPVIVILIGASIIYNSMNFKKNVKYFHKGENGLQNFYGVFGGTQEIIKNKDFEGANIYSVFGGVELDLSDLEFKADSITLNVYSVLGGSDLRLPDNCSVVFNSSAILGANENKYKSKTTDKSKTIYLNCVSILGGTEIK